MQGGGAELPPCFHLMVGGVTVRIAKLHGLGNDYLFIDGTRSMPEHLPELARRLSDRHFGVGGDGLICVAPSKTADFRMRMFNADGSEGEMCGNGIRCMAKFIHDRGLSGKSVIEIETLAGVKTVCLQIEGGNVTGATVDMGQPVVFPAQTICAVGKELAVQPVSMGNPHAVLFVPEPEQADVERLGPAVEHHPAFPNRTNVEFAVVEDTRHLRLRVWERGSGETLACGTGACAAFAAAVKAGRCSRAAEAKLPGGSLMLNWEEASGHMFLTGPAVTVFEGEVWPD